MRLRRSDVAGPGWRRTRHGRGFTYRDASGGVVDAADRERVKALAIPPAWRDVWISPYANGHIQAVGTDDAGRRQYLYHARWHEQRDVEKYARVLGMAGVLPGFREEVVRSMSASGLGRDRVLAVALFLLDRGVFRVGGESYQQDNGSHGVATLLRSHVVVRSDVVDFRYPAKSGIEFDRCVEDVGLAGVVRSLRRSRSGSDRLLVYREGRRWCEVHSEEVNERFKEMVGEGYSVKDLRTWHGTVFAAVAFAKVVLEKGERPESGRGVSRVEAAVMREVAEELGNTAAVARRSYVDPRVVEGFEEGRTVVRALRKVEGELGSEEARRVVERGVVRLLKGK
ncbi:DNA topoisomerase IB [Umezawaea endophytica]|uniref:DNA topoisomerase n=1 Tax=Umezawaea endophytica TaxID=1654476 RepID=A0A9X3A3L5_9PSEU|nr:DNA topoisomerase IB [Umezawaea endophytica]MCS7481859.1 DNA topoisomerase IB [Umezawaea endophytica]